MQAKQTYLEEFFNSLDIQPVVFRRNNKELAFLLRKQIFESHQQYLRRWFMVVEEDEKYIVLSERFRGSDATAH
jgi:hypothetical protein